MRRKGCSWGTDKQRESEVLLLAAVSAEETG